RLRPRLPRRELGALAGALVLPDRAPLGARVASRWRGDGLVRRHGLRAPRGARGRRVDLARERARAPRASAGERRDRARARARRRALAGGRPRLLRLEGDAPDAAAMDAAGVPQRALTMARLRARDARSVPRAQRAAERRAERLLPRRAVALPST